ncbi:MAG: glycosyltransferase family 39 protein, partial [Solobacterium sp.]|nr:glycosyltransferase family 39 protein [Solobacterium sp.]
QPSAGDQYVVLSLDQDTHFDSIYAIYGEGDNNALDSDYQMGFRGIYLYGSNGSSDWEEIGQLDEETRIYRYSILNGDWNYRYLMVYCTDPLSTISEIGVKASGQNRFLPLSINLDPYADSAYPGTLLIDEQDTLSTDPSYMNESFFDEVYHVRNAWEIQAKQRMYSHVHPLVGTGIIAASIRVFGMNPFAWRFPGAVCGVLMIWVMYRILCTLLQNKDHAVLGTFFLAVEFMHMTTSRIGTLEPFSVLFILCMYLYMIRYVCVDHTADDIGALRKNLLLSGIFTGLAIAVKWTGCYSAVGLAIIFFSTMYRDFRSMDRSAFRVLYRQIIPFCVLCYIIIPLTIYFVSYLPTPAFTDGWSVRNVLEQIRYSYHYHSTLTSDHPYQSHWYEWLLDLRPVWYYVGHERTGLMRTIACFNNPVVAVGGLVCVLICTIQAIMKKDRIPGLIAVGYWSALLPWVLVSRTTFSYHYYPASVFLCMALAWVFSKHPKTGKYTAAAACILFVLFLPVLCGFPSSEHWLHFLEWMPDWYWG